MNKLVSKRRKGLSWKGILEQQNRLKEKKRNHFIVIFTITLIAISLLASSLVVFIRTKIRNWRCKRSEDTESLQDDHEYRTDKATEFTKEERKLIAEKSVNNHFVISIMD